MRGQRGVIGVIFATALLPCAFGFSVDDAFILTRVVEHGLRLEKFQFHIDFASDAVTPLGYERWIALLAWVTKSESVTEIFSVQRYWGALAFLFSVGLASFASRAPRWWIPVFLLGAAPALVWSGAGLATATVGLLLVLAFLCADQQHWWAAGLCAGLASFWRPELALSSIVLGWSLARGGKRQLLGWGAGQLAVMSIGTGLRWWSYGTLLPLSAVAKSPAPASGLYYGALAFVWGGAFAASLFLPGAWRRFGVAGYVLVLWCSVVLAGGDWMPGLRLLAPCYPVLLILTGRCISTTQRNEQRGSELRRGVLCWLRLLRWGAVGVLLSAGPLLVWSQGADYRAVSVRRLDLVRRATPVLAQAQVIAAIDIGWVGLASDARLVDLGGVTDPRIGRLAGGHTHRPVSTGMFSDRDVDTWVLRVANERLSLEDRIEDLIPVYGTDARLLARAADLHMAIHAVLPLQGMVGNYVVLRHEPMR